MVIVRTTLNYVNRSVNTYFEDPGFVVEDIDTSVDPKNVSSSNSGAVFTNSDEPSKVFVDPLLQRISPVAASRYFENSDSVANQQTNNVVSNSNS